MRLLTFTFLPDSNHSHSNKCFFSMFSAIHSHLSPLFFHFLFLFSPSFSYFYHHKTHSAIYNVWFDFITTCLHYHGDKTTLHGPRQKKKCRVDYNQNECYNNICYKIWVFTPSLSNYFLFSFLKYFLAITF